MPRRRRGRARQSPPRGPMPREEFAARCRLAEKAFEAMRAGDHVRATCLRLLADVLEDQPAEAHTRPPSPSAAQKGPVAQGRDVPRSCPPDETAAQPSPSAAQNDPAAQGGPHFCRRCGRGFRHPCQLKQHQRRKFDCVFDHLAPLPMAAPRAPVRVLAASGEFFELPP